VLIAVVAGIAGWAAAPLLVAAVPALIATQCHEFGRRVLYTERRLPAVVLVDGIYYAGQVLAFLGLWYGGLLTGATAFLALAGAATLSTVVGLSLIWRNFVGTVDTALMRENWRFGKWLLGATVGDWLASQVITYLSALLLGAAAAAVLKAGSLLIGPVNVLLGFVDSVLPTRFAVVWRDGGKPALTRQMLQAYRFSAPVIVGYSLLVAVFATPLLRLLYGDTYAGYGSVVVLMAVLCATSYLPRILSAALQARGLTRPVFLAYMAAGFVMVGPSVALIKLLGVHGSVLGSIAGTLITFTVLAIQYRRGSAAMAAETSARADRPVQRMATPAAATASHSSGDA
jgi:O-antigen/teichoic acid export membrane protein